MSTSNSSTPAASATTAELAAEADEQLEQAQAEQRQDANQLLGMGLSIGAIGAASAVAFGVVCPVCVVAAPALLAAGAWKRVRCRRR